MRKYGYVRVSAKDQNPERQIIAMDQEGVRKENIIIEMISGKTFQRPKYQKLVKELKKDDILVIKSIDRLGRNYDEILEQWRVITKEKKAYIQVIDMPLLNTDQQKENLTRAFVTDLVLQILAYVAETERNLIRQRQAEGIENALKKGVHFGRKKMTLPVDFERYHILWRTGEMTLREAAAAVSMNHSTFYRRCRELE